MISHNWLSILMVIGMVALAACSPAQAVPEQNPATPLPMVLTPVAFPTPEDLFESYGGGEPRSTGYWLLWNLCADGNQAETARANGGREAGWILLDDLLVDPGVLIGALQVETCLQGVSLLQGRDLQGNDHQNDPAYALAAQLMAAQLNLATGSEYCPGSDQAVEAAQLLLLSLGFNGTGGYLGPPVADPEVTTARILTEKLGEYNSGALCVP